MKSYTLKIEGMSCGHCIKAVMTALQSVPDVMVAEVALGHARINCPPARLGQAARAIHDRGFDVETKGHQGAA
ncbi:MAG: cation transporter [Bacteroidota bacterium]|nr:cation transporter [Bacteroidota bacterium]MDE2833933.1 cation transporter [Bacteroidota bacterium]